MIELEVRKLFHSELNVIVSDRKRTCVFTKLDFRASFTKSHDDLSIHDRDPYNKVIGLSSRNSCIRLSIGFLAHPKPDIMAWNALSPLEIHTNTNC